MNTKANIILVELTGTAVEEYLALEPTGRTKHFAAGLVFGVPQKKVTPEMLELIKAIDYQTPERQRDTKVALKGGQVAVRKQGVTMHELSIRVSESLAQECAEGEVIEKVAENDKRITWALKAKKVAPKVDEVAELKKKLAEAEAKVAELSKPAKKTKPAAEEEKNEGAE